MERRDFLALLASAPIAALAPWRHVLERQTILSTATGPTTILIVSGERGWISDRFVFDPKPRWAIWNPDFEVRVTE